MKVLMATVMQNGLMIQQLQLMVALKQKEIKEEESKRQRERRERRSTSGGSKMRGVKEGRD